MMKSEVNLYGTGENALKFIIENKGVKINCIITNDEDEKRFFMGYKVKHISDSYVEIKERLTVIAVSFDNYWKVKKKLDAIGLTEFSEYIYYSIYNKKIVVIYGNCHAVAIRVALEQNPFFSGQYGVYPLPTIMEVDKLGGFCNDYLKFADVCDVFMHQGIRKENIYGASFASEYLIDQLKTKCRVITIPNTFGLPRFLYPQIKGYTEKKSYEENSYEGREYFPFRDAFIEEVMDSMNVSEIAEAIMRDQNIYDSGDILKNKEDFFNKLQYREKEWDIKLTGFIENNYREQKLFYDPNHPTNYLQSFIVGKVCELLNIPNVNINWDKMFCLDSVEIPVYYCTKKSLNINYSFDNEMRNTGRKLNNRRMDMEEYVRQYINWMQYGTRKEGYE